MPTISLKTNPVISQPPPLKSPAEQLPSLQARNQMISPEAALQITDQPMASSLSHNFMRSSNQRQPEIPSFNSHTEHPSIHVHQDDSI